VGLGSGAVHGFPLFFGAFVDHGLKVEIVEEGEGFFHEPFVAITQDAE
jgi:hypothetical protein